MKRKLLLWTVLEICGLLAAAFAHADTCAGFTWNVSKELALFGMAANSQAGGKNADSAPTLNIDQLYELALQPQNDVALVMKPEKKMLSDGAFAGLAKLKISKPGNYRIAIDAPFWIDVVNAGKPVPSQQFQGSGDCHAPRKIVEFTLPAADFYIQFSGATSERVRVTVTQSPSA
jgi:hypothetical protein